MTKKHSKKAFTKPVVLSKQVLPINLKKLINHPILNSLLEKNYLLYFLFALFIYTFIMNAWVGDDAYITFRTVDNFLHGYGLTWNVVERVQVYTHPLWMFLIAGATAISGNVYFSAIGLSFILCILTLYILAFKIADNKLSAAVGLFVLMLSKAFIDYTTSGLENPLTNFLIVLFIYFYLKTEQPKKRFFLISLTSSLLLVNRMDTILLVLPVLIYEIIKHRKEKFIGKFLLGQIPFILWEIFSIIYYGFPFPNTYYSKMPSNLDLISSLEHGIFYLQNSLSWDPLTLILMILTSIFILLINIKKINSGFYLSIIIGLFCYILYIVKIGGDFMSGRFLSSSFFTVVCLFGCLKLNHKQKYILLGSGIFLIISIILSSFCIKPPLLSDSNFGTDNGIPFEDRWHKFIDKFTIADERAFYYPETGLLPILKAGNSEPIGLQITQGKQTNKSVIKLVERVTLGLFGYYAGQNVYILDELALPDPLLSKLPMGPPSRIGHILRNIPKGYVESIKNDSNKIENYKISKLYDKIKIITRNNLLSIKRFDEIWKFIIGEYDDLRTGDYAIDSLKYPASGDSLTLSEYYSHLSIKLVELKKYQEGVELNLTALKYNPNNTFALINLGNFYFHQKYYDLAVKCWNNSIKLDSTNTLPYKYLLYDYHIEGKSDSAYYYAKLIQQKGFKLNGDAQEIFQKYIKK